MFVLLDVVSFFTNFPLKKTVNIILKRICNERQIPTSLSKRPLEKLILVLAKKRVFVSAIMYGQLDEVSMGGSPGPVLANTIMTECEKVIVDKLIEDDIIKFYIRYVDDILLVIEGADIPYVTKKFNSFNDNVKFTIDAFENCVPHFLDIEIYANVLGIYHKHTQTGQYVNFDSFSLWKWKVSWIRSLVTRAKRICSGNYLKVSGNP